MKAEAATMNRRRLIAPGMTGIAIEPLCAELQAPGVTGMDLAAPAEWATCRAYGITPCRVQRAGSFRQPV
jgi:hypothetical protein